MLHGQIEQNLVDGQLLLDPKGREVWKPWKNDPPSSPCIHYQNRQPEDTEACLRRFWISSSKLQISIEVRYVCEFIAEDVKGRQLRRGSRSPLANNFTLLLGVGIVPVRLVSFPGSGNTWLRYLVESATGVFTGAVYNDTRLYERGE
ncbi:hypothetical protein Pmani_034036 [Petrolisthes manimaculis]|uniref:Uncharacterized protein n=1 Tax=Petrolisthes manimaculis TaxID=1843537 RepID=A0AAE1TQ45_9EUCA|nr:hypothetical protein Pmani_034036 [Petrolisthes manimaculis]